MIQIVGKFNEPPKEPPKEPIRHSIVAFDVENNTNTGEMICVSLFGERKDHKGKTHKVNEFFKDRNELRNFFKKWQGDKNIPFRLYGHNVAYDLAYIEEDIDDATRIENGGRFITARIRDTKIPIYDTMNLGGYYSLEKWIEMLDMNDQGIYKLSLDNLEERNKMDARATWILAKYLQDFCLDVLKIPVKATIGAAALEIFQRRFAKDLWIREAPGLNEYERKGYFGGRCEVFKRKERYVYSYDVHKMYLNIMKNKELPNPMFYRTYKNPKTNQWKTPYNEGKLMILTAKVFIPKQYVAPLPTKSKDNKLIFPTGIITDTWTSIELKNAEKYGVKIRKVYECVVYHKKEKYLSAYAEWIWEEFTKYNSSDEEALASIFKLLGNSLYGKFAQKNKTKCWMKETDYFGSLEGLDLKEMNGVLYVYVKENESDTKHTFPCISAFITAYARIKLLNIMKKHEKDMVYCDTDSVKLLSKLPNNEIGEELGNFGFEYEGAQYFWRPKLYGEKHKGVPKRGKLIKEDDEHQWWEFKRPNKRSESIRRTLKVNKWCVTLKELAKEDNKRVWDANGLDSEPLRIK